MKVLIDECMPKPLIKSLSRHNFRTAQEMGWSGLGNGELLRAAETLFHAFLTADQNLRYQQQVNGRLLSIIVLPTNHWPTLRRHLPEIQRALDSAEPGAYREIQF